MKKVNVIFASILICVLLMSFVSAGFFNNLWSKITGKTVSEELSNSDVNKDCVINIDDISLVVGNMGKTSSSSDWNSNLDVNNDGMINIDDINIVTSHSGKFSFSSECLLIYSDVNDDCIVNAQDLALVVGSQGKTSSSSDWNSNLDINKDGIINTQDVNIVAGNSGKIVPGCDSITCTDSDGGYDIYTKGIVYGKNSKGQETTFTDYCATDGITLVEGFCDSEGFVNGSSVVCSNGCSNGACLEDDEEQCITFDKDIHDSFLVSRSERPNSIPVESALMRATNFVLDGTFNKTDIEYRKDELWKVVKTGVQEGDFFALGELELRIGEINRQDKKVVICENAPNMDIGISLVCTDSDGGYDIYTKGIVYGKNSKGQETTFTDYCATDGITLVEGFCDSEGFVNGSSVVCSNGCSDGACDFTGGNKLCPSVVTGGPEINPGVRLIIDGKTKYCDPFTLTYLEVKSAGEKCINDFECSDNACVNSVCYSLREELEKQKELLEQQTSLIQETICWVKDFLKIQDYSECLNEAIGD